MLHAGRVRRLGALLLALLAPACGDGPVALEAGASMELTLSGLRSLDPDTEGALEVWVHDDAGTPYSAGRPVLPATVGEARIAFDLPVARPVSITVTVEPPGDDDAIPSPHVLLTGDFDDHCVARLSIEGGVTDGRPLEAAPGAHSLFTTSNNVELGYPSYENAGLWLFTLTPSRNEHGTREVKLTALHSAWIYEGWIVYRYGTPQEFWISYGKFRPDLYGLLSSRDNTGSGVFSGDEDYLNGGVEDVPGEEWTTDIFGYDIPGGFDLPLQLDAVDPGTGEAIWMHVITIEPAFDEFEPMFEERPFVVQPYRNPVGAGGPGVPRTIRYQDNAPSGVVRSAR